MASQQRPAGAGGGRGNLQGEEFLDCHTEALDILQVMGNPEWFGSKPKLCDKSLLAPKGAAH